MLSISVHVIGYVKMFKQLIKNIGLKRFILRAHVIIFQRNVNFDIRLDVAFYNEKLSVWEYLVEPLIENGEVRKWYLGIQVR